MNQHTPTTRPNLCTSHLTSSFASMLVPWIFHACSLDFPCLFLGFSIFVVGKMDVLKLVCHDGSVLGITELQPPGSLTNLPPLTDNLLYQ